MSVLFWLFFEPNEVFPQNLADELVIPKGARALMIIDPEK